MCAWDRMGPTGQTANPVEADRVRGPLPGDQEFLVAACGVCIITGYGF